MVVWLKLNGALLADAALAHHHDEAVAQRGQLVGQTAQRLGGQIRRGAGGNGRAALAGIAGFGATAMIIANGQVNTITGLAAVFSAPDDIGVLGLSGAAAAGHVDGILTHCVIYNRLLTTAEAYKVATQWTTPTF